MSRAAPPTLPDTARTLRRRVWALSNSSSSTCNFRTARLAARGGRGHIGGITGSTAESGSCCRRRRPSC